MTKCAGGATVACPNDAEETTHASGLALCEECSADADEIWRAIEEEIFQEPMWVVERDKDGNILDEYWD